VCKPNDESSGDAAIRRTVLRGLGGLAIGVTVGGPSLAQTTAPAPTDPAAARRAAREARVIRPPDYSDDIMRVINLHEFEGVAKKKLSTQAYNYIAAGAADELTLRANRAAFGDYWIRRRVMVDTSTVDTSLELLGHKLDHPVLLGPVGLRRLLNPNGDRLTALAAHQSKAILVGTRKELMVELAKQNQAPMWWAATLGGHTNKADAVRWVKESEDAGASALCVSFDYPYTGARDRPSRDHWESQWSNTGKYNTGDGTVGFQAGMIYPYVTAPTWSWITWAREATKLPIVVKGITTAEDAKTAVEHGAHAIAVSNHGGRTLDGTGGTLNALPEVVDAVNGKVPVLVDGGVRRGGDVIKALALGAKAIMIGRPYLWGLAAFGQTGVQRVVELLQGELRIALGLSGTSNLQAIDRTLVRPAWKAYDRKRHGVPK
jgi:4-hydroxymandelate oxidase